MSITADMWTLLAPMLIGLAGAVAVLLLDAFERPGIAAGVGSVSLAAAAVTSVVVGVSYDVNVLFDGGLIVGGWASYVGAALFGLGAIIVAGDSAWIARQRKGAVAALMVFATVASVVLATSRDLVFFLVALETVAITGYAFVASADGRRSDEAAMKYFVQGAVVTGLLVYAAAVLFGFFGAGTAYDAIRLAGVEASGPALFVIVAFVVAVAFKLSAFPMHSWAPDALETAPPGAAAMLSSLPKAAMLVGASVLFREVLADQFETWMLMFAALATASIVFGNLAALRQVSLQRMLAYSGIAQGGYALVGFVTLQVADFPLRLFAFTYAIGVAGAFLAVRAIRDAMPEWDGTIGGLSGLSSRYPGIAFALAASLFSLTGIPLTAGFWGKFWVFYAAALNGWRWLAFVGFIGSVVSFGYYGGVLRSVYLDGGDTTAAATPDSTADQPRRLKSAAAASIVLAALILVIGVAPFFWGIFGPFQTFAGG